MSKASTTEAETGRACVLVVDDEESAQKLLKAALVSGGLDADAVASAEEALAYLAGHSVDLAVVDIKLPGMSGLDLSGKLTAEHDVEVLLITGDDRNYSYEEAIRYGAADFLVKPLRVGELLVRVRRALAARDMRRQHEQTLSELERLSLTDALTGLYNSRQFFRQLHNEIGRSRRYGHAFSLAVLDLDHFKRVNDGYGHLEGDRVLRDVADAISASVRETDTAYRYGGEEFAVILPETDASEAAMVGERLREAIALVPSGPDDGAPCITVSVGVTQWNREESERVFLSRADAAMYTAKRKGRNCIEIAGAEHTACVTEPTSAPKRRSENR